MRSLNIEKIENKKTKTLLTVSFDTKEGFNMNTNDAFKRLLAISVVSGGSANCIRKVLNGGLSKELDFDLFDELQKKIDDIIYDAVKEIERVEDIHGSTLETQRFY